MTKQMQECITITMFWCFCLLQSLINFILVIRLLPTIVHTAHRGHCIQFQYAAVTIIDISCPQRFMYNQSVFSKQRTSYGISLPSQTRSAQSAEGGVWPIGSTRQDGQSDFLAERGRERTHIIRYGVTRLQSCCVRDVSNVRIQTAVWPPSAYLS